MSFNSRQYSIFEDEGLVSGEAILKMSLNDLVSIYDTSVRLRNCIYTSTRYGSCPFSTVGEYILAGDQAIFKMLKVQHMGRKTAHELDEIIKDLSIQIPVESTEDVAEIFTVKNDVTYYDINIPLDSDILDINIIDLLNSKPCSQRLRNCFNDNIADHSFPCKTVRDVIVGGDSVFRALLKYPNFGRTSANELRNIIKEAIQGVTPNDTGMDTETGIHVTDALKEVLSHLSERELKVISCRYGLDGLVSLTLDDISTMFSVTRERIRQIEKKALKRLGHKAYLAKIIACLDRDRDNIFEAFADGHGILRRNSLRLIPGEYQLIFDLTHGSLYDWLCSFAVEFPTGWVHSDHFTPTLASCCSELEATIKKIKLPVPKSTLFRNLDYDKAVIDLALAIQQGIVVFENLIYSSGLGRRKKRQARLYTLLSHQHPSRLEKLVEAHNKLFPSDRCSTRDAQIVMCEVPHLFISLNDFGWV